MTIAPTGHVTAYTGVSPHGQGSGTTFAQIVADELGVNPADVEVQYGDTAMFPEGGGTGASRGLTVGGSALYAALQEARRKLARIAAHQLQCAEEEIIFQGGHFTNRRKPGQTMAFATVAAAAYDEALLPAGVGAGLEFSGTYTLPANPYAFGAHVAVVEIDRDSGEVRILRYVAVHDCGRIINPKLVEGQMYGGIAQGFRTSPGRRRRLHPGGATPDGNSAGLCHPQGSRDTTAALRNHGNSLTDQSPGRERHR